MKIEVVDVSPLHIGPMIAAMEPSEVASTPHPRRVLRAAVADSAYRRTALLDGRVAAMWGVTGPLAAATGHVWLLMSRAARAVPVKVILALVRDELAAVMATKTELVSFAPAADARALRFMRFLGFAVAEPDAAGNCLARLVA